MDNGFYLKICNRQTVKIREISKGFSFIRYRLKHKYDLCYAWCILVKVFILKKVTVSEGHMPVITLDKNGKHIPDYTGCVFHIESDFSGYQIAYCYVPHNSTVKVVSYSANSEEITAEIDILPEYLIVLKQTVCDLAMREHVSKQFQDLQNHSCGIFSPDMIEAHVYAAGISDNMNDYTSLSHLMSNTRYKTGLMKGFQKP